MSHVTHVTRHTKQEIKITGATIFTNPFQELEDEERAAQEAAAKQVCVCVVAELGRRLAPAERWLQYQRPQLPPRV
jgi:poly-beta-hydroxyalkanoate depolymerase